MSPFWPKSSNRSTYVAEELDVLVAQLGLEPQAHRGAMRDRPLDNRIS